MSYEITILVRDSKGEVCYDAYGNPKRKLFKCDSAGELYDTWIRNSGIVKKKRKAKAENNVKNLGKILEEVDSYTEKVRKKKISEEVQNPEE